jgi:transcriptional regulator with AAA-type ATPase domain
MMIDKVVSKPKHESPTLAQTGTGRELVAHQLHERAHVHLSL